MGLRNLVLDMGNVLLGWEPRAFALRAAGNVEDAEVLFATLFDTPEWHLHDAGQIAEEELLRVSLARTPDRLRDTLRVLFEEWPRWMPQITGVDAFTARAREAGLRLYLLSNAGTRFPSVIQERGFYSLFDGAVVSAHEKVSKPDARIYRRLCERYGLLPGECLFVDDLIENVRGAEAAGMHAQHFLGDFAAVEDRLREFGVLLPGHAGEENAVQAAGPGDAERD
ncbi:MAG TPA: HAD family phosphatase [Candidatus Limnocylindria bacterium]|nr:HAD family phosphatase [Candidatus Limnocylindria bacterium]